MANKYQWANELLRRFQLRATTIYDPSGVGTHCWAFPFISQVAQELYGMLANAKDGRIHCHIGIIAKCHDARIGYLLREEVLRPKSTVPGPSGKTPTIQAVDKNDAELLLV
jgi:hypothetical protein